jgi:hypothetical protein
MTAGRFCDVGPRLRFVGGCRWGRWPLLRVRVVALVFLGLWLLVACSHGGDERGERPPSTSSSTSSSSAEPVATAPPRPASTTTTSFAPETVEGAIEAAYLHAWDVYADAAYALRLDEAALAEVYAGDYLTLVIEDVRSRIAEQRAALVDLRHDYQVELVDGTTALVFDQYWNHSVLVDPLTKVPLGTSEPSLRREMATVSLIDGVWRITELEGIE